MNSGENKRNETPKTGPTKVNPPVRVHLGSGVLTGDRVQSVVRIMADMKGVYRDEELRKSLDQQAVVYRVQTFYPVVEDEEGGLFWGTTFLQPGLVGDEYFMTKGHYHAKPSRGEFYLTLFGNGALILMDEKHHTVFEPMSAGTLHYVPGHTAHRVANTGDQVLTFLACWPSDAGHDYETISRQGFSARLRKMRGVPVLVEEP
ncbi:MAG TPA: glucose-6-phosphate isomerase family protein [Candidatus Limnocylindrales bacterium]|nr:glucose-6-phosphate isomerase family protein [Candidatus Limnocylindrales bacterium]